MTTPMPRAFLLMGGLLALGGCASTPGGSTEAVSFISNPDGATVKLSTGSSCVTPCSIRVRRDTGFTASFEKAGHVSVDVDVSTRTQSSTEKSVDLGPVSVGIASSSAIAPDYTGIYSMEHAPNPVSVELPKK